MHQGASRFKSGAYLSWLEATPTFLSATFHFCSILLIISGSGILPRYTNILKRLAELLNSNKIRREIPLWRGNTALEQKMGL